MKRLNNLISCVAALLAAAAILEQLRRPAKDRTWTGDVLMVPYDFRIPTLQRAEKRLWNPRDHRIFTPTVFGIGWTINFYQVLHRLGLVGA